MRCSSAPMILAITAFACTTDSPEVSRGAQIVVNAANALGESVGFLEARPGLPRAMWRSASGVLIDLGTLPGGSRSSAVAIDDAGTIVGQSETGRGEFRAVRWRHGAIEDLGTLPGGDFSVASAIDGGAVLGESDAGDGMLHAFRWQDGRMTDLGRFSPAAASGGPPPRPDRR
jgi:probable HAF family extracellular repeat protein